MAIVKEFHLSKEGLEELKKELKTLIAQRPEVAEKIKTAREFGDLSENDEYANARDEQARNESRIAEIEYILQNYELIEENKTDDTVGLGNTVVLINEAKKQVTYHMVSSVEVDPAERKISNESPIGQALMGRKVGDKVEIELPVGKTSYKIKTIS